MSLVPKLIVYIWLAPLTVFIVIPLTILLFDSILKLTHTINEKESAVEESDDPIVLEPGVQSIR